MDSGGSIRVLLATDDTGYRDEIEQCLAANGEFSIIDCTDSTSILEQFEHQPVDCLVVDDSLHSTSPLAVIQAVRDVDSSLPILLLVGTDADELVRQTLALDGEVTYVPKAAETETFDLLTSRIFTAIDTARRTQAQSNKQMWSRAVVEHSHVGLFALEDGRVAFVNDHLADLLGISPETLIGQQVFGESPSLLDLVHIDDRTQFSRQISAMADDISRDSPADHYTFEFRVIQDGTDAVRWLMVHAIPVPTDDGNRNVLGYVTDLTDRITHELELAQQNARLEAFAHVLSHDIRGPLAVAQGWLDLARESCKPVHFDRIEQAHTRITELVEDVLSLARDGANESDETEVVLADAAAAAWEMCDTDALDARCEVSELPIVTGDEGQLKRVFENLFRNAIQHGTTDDGSLVVRVGPLPSAGGFYVEDEGTGIPEDIRDDIFLPGVSTKNQEIEAGLGLDIVQHIVDMNGWSIRVADSENGGARFEILFDPLGDEYTSV
ncbi:ATP-binding protein [Haloferax sp. DFSO60]|uniref:ATP-binding protein n=1 Tax=Haloferax sp. DFSO60 TaxID=3388652 RepID=UPI00397AC248